MADFQLVAIFVLAYFTSAYSCPHRCICNTMTQIIDCRDADLDRIPTDLPEPKAVRELYLSRNKIRDIVFELSPFSNLEVLDLSYNEIVRIDDNSFAAMHRLRTLRLDHNRLSGLTIRTFAGLDHLVSLDVSYNYISKVVSNAFNGLDLLEDLHLDGNSISDLGKDAFKGMPALTFLNLGKNLLTFVPSRSLRPLSNLRYLSLDGNHIPTLVDHAFEHLSSLEHLGLSDLNLMHVHELAFSDGATPDTPYLRHLSLNNNRLKEVPTLAIHPITTLEELDLSQNFIEVLQPESFRSMHRLRLIMMNAMRKLNTVKDFAFADLPDLSEVDLSSNPQLKTIEPQAFKDTISLRRVDLHGNALGSISQNLLPYLDLEMLDLRFNPWICTCEIRWMRDLLLNNPHTPNHTLIYKNDVACASPKTLAGNDLVTLTPGQLGCSLLFPTTNYKLTITLVVLLAVFVMTTLLCVVYRYRNTIQAYMGTQNKYKPQRCEDDDEVTMADDIQQPSIDGSLSFRHDGGLSHSVTIIGR